MKFLQSALVLCTLVGSMALADGNKCGCQKPQTKPKPAQVMSPAPAPTQKSAAAPAPAQKDCPAQPKA